MSVIRDDDPERYVYGVVMFMAGFLFALILAYSK